MGVTMLWKVLKLAGG